MNVLNHLGIGLYSNIPAVLSEIVANAWDADATEVKIDIDILQDEIVIEDNGNGMTRDDINKKYLMVGYDKRHTEPGKTVGGRNPMGRKGIGKLSVFSIADTIIVYSAKDGEHNGLMMSRADIQKRIENKAIEDYYPSSINADWIPFQTGTKIILRELKKNIDRTEGFLRTRLARRFSVIGPKENFRVWINGKEITSKERDYYDKIEFLWYMGEKGKAVIKECKNLKKSFEVDPIVQTTEDDWYEVEGWIGTVDEHKSIDDQNNAIIIYAHGKLIQEDVLKDFKEGGVYARYLIGEIDADFMDLDSKDDIVTSDRQRVKEDDPRYQILKEYIWRILKQIQNQWTDLRTQRGVERAIEQPAIKEWYNKWQGDNKNYAKKLFGKIESLKVPDKDAKKELYKASMIAFETMALKNSLSILDSMETEKDFELMTQVFSRIDELEAIHYYEIVKARLGVIKEFERILPDSRERILQKHIFDHLWLLDPSWERASTNQRVEEAVTTEFNDIDAHLTSEEKKGRIDIRYRTAAGKHVIIELKKYERSVTVYELLEQVSKYRDALEKCLQTKFPNASRVIETICVLGVPPEPQNQGERNIALLRDVGARYVTYDTLVQQTLQSYQDYLTREKHVAELNTLIDRVDSEFV